VNGDPVMEFRDMATGGSALTDTGFPNIGARPTRDDQGLGTTDPFGNPWSFTRQFLTTPVDQFSVDIGPLSALTQRVAIDGAMKVPGLRNVAQTPPYFHHGGEGTLGQVVEFYSRGGDRRNVSGGDTSGTGALGEDDAGQVGPSGSNVDGKIAKLGFSTQEQANLVAFLKSLTDDRVRCHAAPFDHPELMISHGVDPAGTPNGKGEAAERFVTLAATGKAGLGAKCAAIANDGDVTQLPAALGAMTK
jgi:hypothetical protein